MPASATAAGTRRGRIADLAPRRSPSVRGGRALVVGGWVRDRILGRDSKDIDLEVFGVPAERLRRCSNPSAASKPVGESFQVYKCGDVDVSLPRRESKAGRGHRGFEVTGDPSMRLEDAARRRDFTINAIAWDPLTGEYLDPFDGRADLAARRLRVVDPATFADDSLRVLRAVQFAARFELTLDDEARAICRRSRSTICRPSASGASSRSCCRRRGRRLASRWRSTSAWWRRSGPSCTRSSAVRRSRSGTPKATSGCTRCR